MSKPKILYITVDGALEPLGYSQVCRVLFGLARRGFDYELLSLERAHDLADSNRVRSLSDALQAAGIVWHRAAYAASGSSRDAATNLSRVAKTALSATFRKRFALIHARAYHSAAIALMLKHTRGIPYLFDARGRWIDERILGGRWFVNPLAAGLARAVERRLYGGAAGAVTLTSLHAQDIRAGDFGAYRGIPLDVVTTCADYGEFQLALRRDARAAADVVPAGVAARLEGKLVIAMVGSINSFYRHEDALRLLRRIFARRLDAHLLVLSRQEREYSRLFEEQQIDPERVTISTAKHTDMSKWLSRIDWGLQILNEGVAKRGSMPTKLAEFFAAGVRPLHFGCNSEVTEWVRRAGSGFVLSDLSDGELDRAADHVCNAPAGRELLELARERTRPHFDLQAGIERYATLLDALLRPSA